MNDLDTRHEPDGSWRIAALALVEALGRRGLDARLCGHGVVRASNPAGEPDPDDPFGALMHPGLRQEVLCHRRDGALWWLWVWTGPTRQSPPELEPLCPAAETDKAAERIARVLAVPFTDSSGGS
ncbi:hypothetical protein F8568_006765 [Actinomadura sp. LD22]|uniref:Uncharacterized protein n=1 Tax=Actinomadura physcomitrii TaxID=2650748 RepID=A0A6I4M8I2_9ACTN|nr:hypothetical protein [Actinomadura physcomitrii]MWA00081.1 hypothetical protein [Actinomadura physcomitrii]